ncbi:B3 domain-containing protein [Rosa sericea]
MATERNPSFFKVLQGDQLSIKLKIPRAFLQYFNGQVPPKCFLQTLGQTWLVDVEKVNHKFYFQLGWNRFVQDNGLKYGQLLVFRYAGNSDFHVDMFGINTCKKLCVIPEMEEANEHDDDVYLEILDDFPPSQRRTKEKSLLSSPLPHKKNKTSSSGRADITPNFRKRVPHLEKSQMKRKKAHWFKSEMINNSDTDSGDEDYHDEEDDDENEDDEEEEEETQDEEVEEEDDGDSVETLNDSLPCSRTVGKYTLASRLHQRKRKSSSAKAETNIKTVDGLSREEKILKALALQRANAFKSNSVNPCFMVSLSATYARGAFLNLPRSFVAIHFTNPPPGHVILWVEKSSWFVKVSHIGTATRLQAGWSEFVHVNNLKIGDACVFVLTDAINFQYDVEIFRVTDAVCT